MATLVRQLKDQGTQLFDGRGTLMSYCQQLAEHFYPERADFTLQRQLGAERNTMNFTSYPLMIRRDLGNTIGAMLRPSTKRWAKMRSKRADKTDTEGKQWLEWFTELQFNAMYDKVAMFKRATTETDHDWVTFGQGVIQNRWIRPTDGGTPHLHFQCHHFRDTAWAENEFGVIGPVYRKAHPFAIDAVSKFKDKVHNDWAEKAQKTPFEKVEAWHCFLPLNVYDNLDGVSRVLHPWVQFWFDPHHDIVLEQTPSWVNEYVIPRWQTVSGSQYAFSPATVAALPDARLIQNVTLVLLEAGQKATNPPMIGVREAVRSDIDIQAGGFTAVDPEFVEHLDNVLRPITQDIKGINFGHELVKDIREQLSSAFLLNKLNLPSTQISKEMTAYEVGQRVQEFIRNALPLVEPVEADYNGQLCETVMQLILHNDLGVARDIPNSLRGPGGAFKDMFEFTFESPLRDAIDKEKVGDFTEALQIISQAVPHDQSAALIMDFRKATRDALDTTVPADWLRTEDVVDQMDKNQKAQVQQQQLLDLMGKGAAAAKDAGAAAASSADAMQTTGPT